MAPPLSESVAARTRREFWPTVTGPAGWLVGVILGVLAGVASLRWGDMGGWAALIFVAASAVATVLWSLVLLLLRIPLRQRDEARSQLNTAMVELERTGPPSISITKAPSVEYGSGSWLLRLNVRNEGPGGAELVAKVVALEGTITAGTHSTGGTVSVGPEVPWIVPWRHAWSPDPAYRLAEGEGEMLDLGRTHVPLATSKQPGLPELIFGVWTSTKVLFARSEPQFDECEGGRPDQRDPRSAHPAAVVRLWDVQSQRPAATVRVSVRWLDGQREPEWVVEDLDSPHALLSEPCQRTDAMEAH